MKRQLFIIGLLTMLLFIPLAAWAALVGKITNIEGRMDITPPGKVAVTAKIGDPVSVGDIIRTKSKSKCEITFSNGNVIRLAEETRLQISEYMLKDRQQYSTFNLFRGKVRSIVKKLEELSDVSGFRHEIFTPTCAIGVRGTDFIAFYQAGVSGATFSEGTGYGYSINKPQEIRAITAGQTMIVTSPDIPPFVRPATTDEIGKHMKDTTPSEKPKGEEEKGKEDTKSKGPQATAEAKTETSPATAEAKTDVGKTDSSLSQTSPATVEAYTDSGTTNLMLSQTSPAATALPPVSAPPLPPPPYVPPVTPITPVTPVTPPTTPVFSSALSGYTYTLKTGTFRDAQYRKGFTTTPGWFDTIRYERFYFDDGSGVSTKVFGMEKVQQYNSDPGGGYHFSTYQYNYLPNGRYIKTDQSGFTGGGLTADLGTINLASDPPQSFNFTAWLSGYPSNQAYYKVEEFSIDGTSLASNGTFSGTMSSTDTLWSASASSPANLTFNGSYDATGDFRISTKFESGTSTSTTTPDGGAYVGFIAGPLNNNQQGLMYGIYINPDSNQAGVLKGTFIGAMHSDTKTWDATGSIYPTLFTSTPGVTAANLLAKTATGDYLNLFQGAMSLDTTNGAFDGSPASSIGGYGGGSGYTLSIKGQPWGIYSMYHAVLNSYYNPDGKTAWSARFGGSGEFGQYQTNSGGWNSDYGLWAASISGAAWTNGGLAGTMDGVYGKFLTYTQTGVLKDGKIVGGYQSPVNGSGGFSAVSMGVWEKTQDLSFSSEIWGQSFTLHSQTRGSYNNSSTGSNYYYAYDNAGQEYRKGWSNYYDNSLNKRVNNEYDIIGPPTTTNRVIWTWTVDNATGQVTWTGGGTYTDDTLAGLTSTLPTNFGTPTTSNTWQEYDIYYNSYGSFSGIMGGLNNLWTATKDAPASLTFLGSYDSSDITTSRPYLLVRSNLLSFDPRNTINDPYQNSTSPMGGAYFAYLGAIINEYTKTLTGNILGLYVDAPDASGVKRAGFLKGSLNGTVYPGNFYTGMWEATGSVYPIQIDSSTTASPQSFVGAITQTSDTTYYNMLNPDGSSKNSNQMYYMTRQLLHSSVSGASLYTGVERVELAQPPAGSYAIAAGMTGGVLVNFPTNGLSVDLSSKHDYYSNTNLIATNYQLTTITANQLSANVGTLQGTGTGARANWVNAGTSVYGFELKGVFDPISSVFQTAYTTAFIGTGKFLNMAATTDGQTALSQLNIPCIQVGQANLTGSAGGAGNSISLNMTGVKFFSYSTGDAPKIWATGSIGGTYNVSSSPSGMPPTVTLTGSNYTNASGLSATATHQFWDTTNNKWGSTIGGSGTVNAKSIVFGGVAAGTLSGGSSGTFGGTGAGIARPQ